MVVAGGGTGGHLFPGLAVAEAAAAQGASILFVGSSTGIEARVVPQTRFPFRAIPIHGLRGRGWRGLFQLAWQLPAGVVRAWRILGAFGSDVVLGVGGYASFPIVTAAWLRGVPSVLLEQNARPGWANRVLGRVAARVCTTFAESNRYFPSAKVVLTGNPVRAFAPLAAAEKRGFTVLAFGGSQGAHRINEALHEAAPLLRNAIPGFRIIHQTGAADHDRLQARYRDLGVAAEVRPFIDDMGAAYGRADLVVCRAGATTVAELTALGMPAILIPYPFAADDHQRANAEVLAQRDAGILILDRELTGDRLATAIIELAEDRARLTAMGAAARSLAAPDSAARVVGVCCQVVAEGG